MTETSTHSASRHLIPTSRADPTVPAPDETVTPSAPATVRMGPRRPSRSAWPLVGAVLFVGGYLAAGGGVGSAAPRRRRIRRLLRGLRPAPGASTSTTSTRTKLAEARSRACSSTASRTPSAATCRRSSTSRRWATSSGQLQRDRRRDGASQHRGPGGPRILHRASATSAAWWSWRRWTIHRPRRPAPGGRHRAAVDGESVDGLDAWTSRSRKIRGETGTDVTLTMQRDDGEPFDLTITRDEIRPREVETG